jgi:hypothetical protein
MKVLLLIAFIVGSVNAQQLEQYDLAAVLDRV